MTYTKDKCSMLNGIRVDEEMRIWCEAQPEGISAYVRRLIEADRAKREQQQDAENTEAKQ